MWQTFEGTYEEILRLFLKHRTLVGTVQYRMEQCSMIMSTIRFWMDDINIQWWEEVEDWLNFNREVGEWDQQFISTMELVQEMMDQEMDDIYLDGPFYDEDLEDPGDGLVETDQLYD